MSVRKKSKTKVDDGRDEDRWVERMKVRQTGTGGGLWVIILCRICFVLIDALTRNLSLARG